MNSTCLNCKHCDEENDSYYEFNGQRYPRYNRWDSEYSELLCDRSCKYSKSQIQKARDNFYMFFKELIEIINQSDLHYFWNEGRIPQMMSQADSGRGTVLRSPANLIAVEVRSPQRNEALSRHYDTGDKSSSVSCLSFKGLGDKK